jgi:hypothetical protein
MLPKLVPPLPFLRITPAFPLLLLMMVRFGLQQALIAGIAAADPPPPFPTFVSRNFDTPPALPNCRQNCLLLAIHHRRETIESNATASEYAHAACGILGTNKQEGCRGGGGDIGGLGATA